MPRGPMRSDALDELCTRIVQTTIEQKRTIFLFADRQDFEQSLVDLQTFAHHLTYPKLYFDGEVHKITHNVGCTNEISTWAYTIYGEVQK